jgi:hypothetical protein
MKLVTIKSSLGRMIEPLYYAGYEPRYFGDYISWLRRRAAQQLTAMVNISVHVEENLYRRLEKRRRK